MLKEGQAISKIAKEVNITKQTVYRIKHDNDRFNKLYFDANESFSQSLKTNVHNLFKFTL